MSGVAAIGALFVTFVIPAREAPARGARPRCRGRAAPTPAAAGARVNDDRLSPRDSPRRDRRDRRRDHVDPRHDDRQRRARVPARDLNAPLSTIQWVATGYLLSLATVIPLTGWAAERFGPRLVWMTVVAGFVVTSALCALAWSAESLIAFRVLQGIAGGMIMPIGMITLAQTAGPSRVGRVMSVIGVPMLLAPVLGPVLGGLIVAAPELALDLPRQPPDRGGRAGARARS